MIWKIINENYLRNNENLYILIDINKKIQGIILAKSSKS